MHHSRQVWNHLEIAWNSNQSLKPIGLIRGWINTSHFHLSKVHCLLQCLHHKDLLLINEVFSQWKRGILTWNIGLWICLQERILNSVKSGKAWTQQDIARDNNLLSIRIRGITHQELLYLQLPMNNVCWIMSLRCSRT